MLQDANGVRRRTQATVYDADGVVVFPPEVRARIHGRDNRVLITHRGETRVFDTPEALDAALRDSDPRRAEVLARARETLTTARAVLAAAQRRQARADRLMRWALGGLALAALSAGVILLGCVS